MYQKTVHTVVDTKCVARFRQTQMSLTPTDSVGSRSSYDGIRYSQIPELDWCQLPLPTGFSAVNTRVPRKELMTCALAHNPQPSAACRQRPTLNGRRWWHTWKLLSLSYLVGKNNFREGNNDVLRVQTCRSCVEMPWTYLGPWTVLSLRRVAAVYPDYFFFHVHHLIVLWYR